MRQFSQASIQIAFQICHSPVNFIRLPTKDGIEIKPDLLLHRT